MKKRALLFPIIIALIAGAALVLSGCPQASSSPGTMTGVLSNGPTSGTALYLVGVFNEGETPGVDTEIGSIYAVISVSGDATGTVQPTGGGADIVFNPGNYLFSILVDLNGNTNPDTGEKAIIIPVTVNGNMTITANYSGTGWTTIP